MFKDCLAEAMREKGLTATELSKMTGISKPSISQYLKGKNAPSAERIRKLETALGVELPNPGYDRGIGEPRENFHRMKVDDAAKLMHVSGEVIRRGLRQNVFPWGYAVRAPQRYVYIINADKFREIEGMKG